MFEVLLGVAVVEHRLALEQPLPALGRTAHGCGDVALPGVELHGVELLGEEVIVRRGYFVHQQ